MYNWNTDTTFLRKNRKTYTVWKLNQLINFGLHGKKLDLTLVKKYWKDIHTDRSTQKFLKLLIWGK